MLWVRFPGNTCTDKNMYSMKDIKLLWIKASVKRIHVNVKQAAKNNTTDR